VNREKKGKGSGVIRIFLGKATRGERKGKRLGEEKSVMLHCGEEERVEKCPHKPGPGGALGAPAKESGRGAFKANIGPSKQKRKATVGKKEREGSFGEPRFCERAGGEGGGEPVWGGTIQKLCLRKTETNGEEKDTYPRGKKHLAH